MQRLPVRIDNLNAILNSLYHDIQAILAINGNVGHFAKTWQTHLPASRRTEAVNAAISTIGDVNPTLSIECDCEWLPGVGQACRGWWSPGSAPDKSVQTKDTQAMVPCVTDVEITRANANPVGGQQLSAALATPSEKKNGLKKAFTRIEALQLHCLVVQQVEIVTWIYGHIGGGGEANKTFTRLGGGASSPPYW